MPTISMDVLQYMVTRYEQDGDKSFYSTRKLHRAFPNVRPRVIQKTFKELHQRGLINASLNEMARCFTLHIRYVPEYQLNFARMHKIKNLLKEHIEFKLRVAETRRLLDSNRAITALKS